MVRLIQKDLEMLEEELLRAVVSPVDRITEIGTHLVKAGGKRLRPALYLLAARSGREFSMERAMPLAVAIELIHMASLVHDDVLDHADLRRGKETANARWGNQQAILSGDYLFARAFSLVAGAGYGDRISMILSNLIMDLSVGEIIQNMELYKVETIEAYDERIAKKTANFLADCCEMGGIVAGHDEETLCGLRTYGKKIGMAFQLTDDLLDVLGDAKDIGKPAGHDIAEGIITLPFLRALETSAERDELRAVITNPNLSAEDVERALAIVRAGDGADYTRKRVHALLEEAKAALPKALPKDIVKTYCEAADHIAKRNK
ncbi:polyprenyl synthetase family protein [Selenomonas sp. TAMA-11512]|uniref:polyprenyl synthetase family protein n=1 Tax=Selenomonas sp. TAMA-11512 TaxID=3095337 RepID=UPI0030D18881